MRRRLSALLKIAVAAALMAWVLGQVDFEKIWNYVAQLSALHIVLCLIFSLLAQFFSVLRIRMILASAGAMLQTTSILKLSFIGAFFNVLLPSGIGGDAVKIYALRHRTELGVKHLVQLVIADRASGLFVLCMMVLFLACMLEFSLSIPFFYEAIAVAFPLLTTGYLLCSRWFLAQSAKSSMRALPYSLLSQFCWAMVVVILCVGLSKPLQIPEYLLLYCTASIATTIPISVGGLGLRESVFFYGAHVINLWINTPINAEISVAISLCLYAMIVITTLPGALFLKEINQGQ